MYTETSLLIQCHTWSLLASRHTPASVSAANDCRASARWFSDVPVRPSAWTWIPILPPRPMPWVNWHSSGCLPSDNAPGRVSPRALRVQLQHHYKVPPDPASLVSDWANPSLLLPVPWLCQIDRAFLFLSTATYLKEDHHDYESRVPSNCSHTPAVGSLSTCRGHRELGGLQGLCPTEAVPAMSTPSLSKHLALMAAEFALTGHPAVAGLVVAVDQLATELAALREENANLWRELRRHSGQPGHAGTIRSQMAPAQVDVGIEHWPERCSRYDAALPREDAGPVARRQVHDLPVPPPLTVAEHQAHAVCCPQCRARTRAAFPTDVAEPVQWGPRLQALVAYLPVARLARLLRELHEVTLATARKQGRDLLAVLQAGTYNLLGRVAEKLQLFIPLTRSCKEGEL